MSNKQNEEKKVIVEKNNGFNMIEVIIIIIVSVLFGIIVGSIITNSKKGVAGTKVSNELQEFVTTYNNVLNNYYGKVNEKELVDSAIKGMLESLDDPYSMYMDNEETEEFDQTINGSYSGIGATVGIKDNNKYIISMFDKSPAKKAGLKEGDIFIKVDGKDVKDKSLKQLTDMIKGVTNTKVKVTVLRGNEEITKTIVRSNVELPSVTSKVIDKDGKKVGYIYVGVFAANTYKQFNDELNKLEAKKIDSLIIDVRSNPGGHLEQVTKILDLFMSNKKVLYQVEAKGKREKKYAPTKRHRTYKVAVLIDSGSASAAEILAAAFKESYGNSVIVGTKSYGKGTVQNAYKLSNGSSLKYTTEKWLTPKGNWIDKAGVEPTEVVEFSDEYKNNPIEDNDNQLQKAIEKLTEKESN